MHLCKLARFIKLNDDGLQASLNKIAKENAHMKH
jgi:hypothetical protein